MDLEVSPHPLPEQTASGTDSHPIAEKCTSELSVAALQHLPIPVLVLDIFKVVRSTNVAAEHLLGYTTSATSNDEAAATRSLHGKALSELGVFALAPSTGKPEQDTLGNLLDGISQQAATCGTNSDPSSRFKKEKNAARTIKKSQEIPVLLDLPRASSHGAGTLLDQSNGPVTRRASMLVTPVELHHEASYLTLTFVDIQQWLPSPRTDLSLCRQSIRSGEEASRKRKASPYSEAGMPGEPRYPVKVASSQRATKALSETKLETMTKVILGRMDMIVMIMWADKSIFMSNRAFLCLARSEAPPALTQLNSESLSDWELWDPQFERRLLAAEFPISILVDSQKPFPSIKAGIKLQGGKKLILDFVGEAIKDPATGEFMAGIVMAQDPTKKPHKVNDMSYFGLELGIDPFQDVLTSMPQLVWTCTPDGLADSFNDRWREHTGQSLSEAVGHGWLQAIHPDDISSTMTQWNASVGTGKPFEFEYRLRRKDGMYRWMLARATPLVDPVTTKVKRWFGTTTDIHEGIESKLEARKTREQLLSVLTHAKVTILVVGGDHKVSMLEGAVSHDLALAHGYQTYESRWYAGRSIWECFEPLHTDLDFTGLINNIMSGTCGLSQIEHQIGDRWYRSQLVPTDDDSNSDRSSTSEICKGVIGLIQDVTELKIQEEELKKQTGECQQLIASEAAAKMSSQLKSQFLANMSHEIRTPIGGIIGMSELLLQLDLGSEQRDYAETINRSSDALLQILNDILDFSRVEAGRLDLETMPFSLTALLRDMERMFALEFKQKGLETGYGIAGIDSGTIVCGDPGRLRQIIINLLSNSIKFTSRGFVRFFIQAENESDRQLSVKFTVKDSGIGIPESSLDKLFQPFRQGDASTARRFGGTGLGLTICKALVDLMKGRIELQSKPGDGTTVTFWITFQKATNLDQSQTIEPAERGAEHLLNSAPQLPPKTPESREQATCSQPQHHSPAQLRSRLKRDGGTLHVLIAEDNIVNQKLALKMTSQLGVDATAVSNGREVLEYLVAVTSRDAARPKLCAQTYLSTGARHSEVIFKMPDLILMDVQMPEVDGCLCTHVLRTHHPYAAITAKVPIVAMTASAIKGDREKCLEAGMDDYLCKPVRSASIEETLLKWCGEGHSVSHKTGPPALATSQAVLHVDSCAGAGCSHRNDQLFGFSNGSDGESSGMAS